MPFECVLPSLSLCCSQASFFSWCFLLVCRAVGVDADCWQCLQEACFFDEQSVRSFTSAVQLAISVYSVKSASKPFACSSVATLDATQSMFVQECSRTVHSGQISTLHP